MHKETEDLPRPLISTTLNHQALIHPKLNKYISNQYRMVVSVKFSHEAPRSHILNLRLHISQFLIDHPTKINARRALIRRSQLLFNRIKLPQHPTLFLLRLIQMTLGVQ
jgi:hypothetical protein